MGDVATFISAGGAGMLALGFVYLLASNRQDRTQYEEAVDRAEKRADAAEERARAAREVAEEARRARFAAEETASGLRAEIAVLRRIRGDR